MMKLIVEMKMPQFCIWCDDKNEPHRCPLLNEDDNCVLQDSNIWMGWNEQYAHCPIKGVLPEEHGDLIDRDEVKKEIMKRMPRGCMSGSSDREGIVCTRRMMLYPISHAKVIVAAERKDDERTDKA